MKLLIIGILFAALSGLDAAKGDFEAVIKECSQKNNVRVEDVKKFFDGDMKPADVTQDLKCFLLCVSEKDGVTKDGEFQPLGLSESLSNSADKNQITQVINACKDLKGSDNCDTSYKLLSCIMENKPKRKV